MIEQYAHLEPCNTQDKFERIVQLAREDSHDVINPTDVVMKNGEIVGYMSIASSPIIVGHFSTVKMHARDSFMLVNIAEHIVRRTGSANVIWPIGKESPFHQYFEKAGYKKLANVDLFVKEF